MLKAKATLENGEPLLIFGLDHENLRRLKDGKPIRFSLKELGMKEGEIIIMSGESINSMAAELGIDLH